VLDDDCGMFGGTTPQAGDLLFSGNASMTNTGVTWMMDFSPAPMETQWVSDLGFYGVIEELGQSEPVEGMRATYVISGAWSGVWTADTELTALVEMFIECVGADCAQAEAQYAENNNGITLPCRTGYEMDGAIAR
jgi:hypothetical protein